MKSWLNNQQLRHPLSVPVLLVAAILAVYYPAMLSGIHTIDDPGIISLYSASPPLSQVLLPGSGYYYRPLIELSFWIDNRLWGMEPCVMHLENILLHSANVVQVLLLARRISAIYPDASTTISPFAALFFALHPLNVEAVGWIAGRTDSLLALFCLSACYFWLRWLDEPAWSPAVLAVLLFICAALTKETALAFIPVIMLLTLVWPASPGSVSLRRRRHVIAFLASSGALLVLLAFALRLSATAMAQMTQGEAGVVQVAQDALAAFGFYWKKMLIPQPLNFAITDVPAAYGLLGAVVLLFLALMFKRSALPAAFFAAAALMIMPALVVAVRHISWTPIAERYMYLPTAFFSLGICCILSSQKQKVLARLAPILLLLLLVAALTVRDRSALWRHKLLFYQDAVAKSPGFGSLYNELGSILLMDGKIDEAAEAFATADRLNERPSARLLIKGNVMATMIAAGRFAEARGCFFQLFQDKTQAPVSFLELLQNADHRRHASLAGKEKAALSHDLMDTLGLLYDKTADPFWLYQSGKLARGMERYSEASAFFRRAYAEAPADAHYREAARRQMLTMEKL